MANMRRKLRVVVKGNALEVETSALDIAHAERDGEGQTVMGFRTAHAACRRNGLDVPAKFETFLELLDEFTDLTGEEDEDEAPFGVLPDPTQAKA